VWGKEHEVSGHGEATREAEDGIGNGMEAAPGASGGKDSLLVGGRGSKRKADAAASLGSGGASVSEACAADVSIAATVGDLDRRG